MKYNILICILTVCFVQCKEDAITLTTTVLEEGNSISGSVFEDLDLDGIGDVPVEKHLVLYGDSIKIHEYALRCDVSNLVNGENEIYYTFTDANGYYIFSDLPPSEFKALYVCQGGFTRSIRGTDTTPDGDIHETKLLDRINIGLTEGEEDDGNNFVVSSWKGSIRGSVLLDLDNDLMGDVEVENYTVNLWRRNNNGDSDGFLFGSNLTLSDGSFAFENLAPNRYLLKGADGQELDVVFASDISPDPDGEVNSQFPLFIAVDLDDGEADIDNNFVVVRPEADPANVTGYVLDDIDLDGIGDEGLGRHRIEIYERDANGVPTSPNSLPIQATYSDDEGFFSFSDIPQGKYVLYHIGTPDYAYDCLSGSDLSPEAGEPTVHPQCFFIQTDIQSNTTDEDNVFLLDKK